jgi:hypothetical protein
LRGQLQKLHPHQAVLFFLEGGLEIVKCVFKNYSGGNLFGVLGLFWELRAILLPVFRALVFGLALCFGESINLT